MIRLENPVNKRVAFLFQLFLDFIRDHRFNSVPAAPTDIFSLLATHGISRKWTDYRFTGEGQRPQRCGFF